MTDERVKEIFDLFYQAYKAGKECQLNISCYGSEKTMTVSVGWKGPRIIYDSIGENTFQHRTDLFVSDPDWSKAEEALGGLLDG